MSENEVAPGYLDKKLAEAYIGWQKTYLAHMPPPEEMGQAEYTSRMCCIAFTEGAKAMQLMLNQALLEIFAEQNK